MWVVRMTGWTFEQKMANIGYHEMNVQIDSTAPKQPFLSPSLPPSSLEPQQSSLTYTFLRVPPWWIYAPMESGQDVRRKYIRQRGTAFLNLLSLKLSVWPTPNSVAAGDRAVVCLCLAPLSVSSQNLRHALTCNNIELHHISTWYRS